MKGLTETPGDISVGSDFSCTSDDSFNNVEQIYNNEELLEFESQRKGGQTTGTTLQDEEQQQISVQKALTKAAGLCSHAKATAKNINQKMRNG
jgi:hypothetical protein